MLGNIIVGIIILGIVVLAIRSIRKDKKNGGCAGGCSGCGGACHTTEFQSTDSEKKK